MKHLSFYNKKSCSITGNVIFIYILLSCLAFFTAGCGHSNLYIDGMDKNTAVPALKVPVKFYVKNNIYLSNCLVRYYPHLFTSDAQSHGAIPISVNGYGNGVNAPTIHSGVSAIKHPFIFFVRGDGGFINIFSVFSCGLLPGLFTKDGSYKFEIKINDDVYNKELPYNITSVKNLGLIGFILPTSFLIPLKTPLAKGIGSGNYVHGEINESKLKEYCQVFVHILSTIPEEKIEEIYFSKFTPHTKLLN